MLDPRIKINLIARQIEHQILDKIESDFDIEKLMIKIRSIISREESRYGFKYEKDKDSTEDVVDNYFKSMIEMIKPILQ